MTQNNYPEGLDELAVKAWDDKPGHIASYEFIKDNARALLDAMAERGYVLVDAKKQEPVAWQFYDNGRWWNGDDRIRDHRKNTEEAGYPIRDLYTHPAIPGRVVFPDAIREGVEAAFEQREGWQQKIAAANRALDWTGEINSWHSQPFDAPTPPTQQQGDGSLRRDLELLFRWAELCEKGHGITVASEIRAAMEASNGNA